MASQTGNHRRHELMPLGASRKRKDRDELDDYRGPPLTTKLEPAPRPAPAPRQQQPQQPAPPTRSGGGNLLLAGYLAHEFMTRGTLFGQRWDPAAAAAKPTAQPLLPNPQPQPQQQKLKQPAPPPEPKQGKPPAGYAEVAYLLKTDGVHIPGVVNPTQLARLLRM